MLYKERQMFKGETLHSIDPNRLVYELKATSPEKTTMGERSTCLKNATFEHLIDAETGKILSFGSRCKIENFVSGLAGFDKWLEHLTWTNHKALYGHIYVSCS